MREGDEAEWMEVKSAEKEDGDEGLSSCRLVLWSAVGVGGSRWPAIIIPDFGPERERERESTYLSPHLSSPLLSKRRTSPVPEHGLAKWK